MNPILHFAHLPHGNLGDKLSCPAQYLEFPGFKKHILSISALGNTTDATPCIIGGGGLLFPSIDTHVKNAVESRIRIPLILWGIGHNTHGHPPSPPSYPDWIKQADLVGVRDAVGHRHQYVPCASCLHPVFDDPVLKPIQDYVVYAHHHIKVVIPGPMINNWQHLDHLQFVVRFLSSGEVVVTNTYHGIYWAALLGRKILCFEPFSSRFLGFPFPLVYADRHNWKEKLSEALDVPDFLRECRNRNMRFYTRALEALADYAA